MKDINEEVKEVLSTVLPTYYELFLDTSSSTPCISYQLTQNMEESKGNTLCWERINLRVKLWVSTVQEMVEYSNEIDEAVATLGTFRRTSANELNEGDLICRIMDYSILIPEIYTKTRY